MKGIMVSLVVIFSLCVFVQAGPALSLSPASDQNNPPTAQAPPESQAKPGERGLSEKGRQRIMREVHHELVLLPFYGVFDNLAYQVSDDGTVTLIGQVVRPTLKSDAENSVKRIEGVEKVVNNIQVLPLSPNDDRIRRAAYRKIYGNSVLNQYELRAVPPSTSS